MPGGHQIPAAVLAGPHQITGCFLLQLGIVTAVICPRCSSRAKCAASRASVLTRSPAGRINFDGAATSQMIPAAVKSRANPNPVGPAS